MPIETVEPMLIKPVQITFTAAVLTAVEMDFNLADEQAIAIWGWEVGHESAFPAVDQQVNGGFTLDEDASPSSVPLLWDDDECFARFSKTNDLTTSGSRSENNMERQFFPAPIITVQNIQLIAATNNVGLVLNGAIYFQHVRLDEASLIRQIVRRR